MKRRLPIIIFLSVFFLLFPYSVAAQTSSLTVAPSRQELSVDPGESTAVVIKFLNRNDEPVSGFLKVADFVVQDKKGTPTFIETPPTITGTASISRRFSAASWFQLPYERMTIGAEDKVSVQAKITVPANARPGGRYVAVYFEAGGTLPKAKGALREAASPVAHRIASLVYLRVSGPITEKARVVRFTAPRFSEYGPVTITTELANQGDYHIRPKGTITVTNLLGKQVDKVKLREANIFPDASLVYENLVGQKWMLGKYKAKLVASYGESGKVLTSTIFFWVFPWRVATATVLAGIIALLLLNLLYNQIRTRQQKLEKRIKELEKKLKEKSTGEES